MLNADHLALLTARGLDSETLVRFGVESNVKLGTSCVVIPFHRDGQVVNRKFRTIAGDKQFSQDAGAVKCFWNIDAITDPALKPRVLAKFDDGTPFLVTRRIGKGSVAWLASGLTGSWNTLAKTNAMLLCDRLLRGMLADTLPAHTIPSADRFTLPVAAGGPVRTLSLRHS